VPLLLFAAILLVAALAFNLAYLDTGGEAIPAVPNAGGSEPSTRGPLDPGSVTSLLILLAFLAAVVVSVLLVLKNRRRRAVPSRPRTWWDVLVGFAWIAVFFALAYLWPRIAENASRGTNVPPGSEGGAAELPSLPTVAGISAGIFLAGALLAGLLVVVLVLRSRLVLFEDAGEGPVRAGRRAAVRAVEATIGELRLGGDVREAILACFARFCALLGARGLADQEALTPRELEDLAVSRLRVTPEAAEALTSLFEEARYSDHPLGEADRERAVRSLEGIRASLEA